MDDNDMDAILTPERPTILHYEEGVAKDNPVAIFVLVVLLLLVVKFIRSRHTNDSDITPVLTQELRTILRNDVAYDQKEAEENCKFMWDAVSGLIRVMCEIDPLFNAVYTRLVHAGSYYEDLRITKADEFDLQIVLDFPFPTDSFTISVPNAESPFVTYQLNESLQQLLYRQYMWLQPYVRLAKFTDKDGFLSSEKVLQWIHGVMEQTLESDEFTTPKSVLEMTRKPQLCSCPAFTLEITGAYTGTTISVDLVPVLNIFGTKIPRKMHKSKRFRQLLRDQENVEWFLVPKPPKDSMDARSQNLWRSAFPFTEKELLLHTGCLKDVIKIFKRLRDLNGNWRKAIYSYSIKAFLLRKYDENPDLAYWSDDNLGQVFLQSLEAFQGAMERCYIPEYFNPKANMLENIKPEVARNIAGRVKNIIGLLRKDPDSIRGVF